MLRLWKRTTSKEQAQVGFRTEIESHQLNNPESSSNIYSHGRFDLDNNIRRSSRSRRSLYRNQRMDSFYNQIQNQFLSPENVAAVPPPGMAGPCQVVFAPHSSRYLAFVSTTNNSIVKSKNSQSGLSTCSLYVPLTHEKATSQTIDVNEERKSSTQVTDMNRGSVLSTERLLLCIDLESGSKHVNPLLTWNTGSSVPSNGRSGSKRRMLENNHSSTSYGDSSKDPSLDDKLRRERQRLNANGGSLTQFTWTRCQQRKFSLHGCKNGAITTKRDNDGRDDCDQPFWRILVPVRGSLYVQDGFPLESQHRENVKFPFCSCIYDKSTTGIAAVDAQLSPDGSMVAWTANGEIFVQAVETNVGSYSNSTSPLGTHFHSPIRISFGAVHTEEVAISHGVADFVAQEEMDRYRGFWWHPDGGSLLFTRNDESQVPLYRILHSHPDTEAPGTASAIPSTTINPEPPRGNRRYNATSMFEEHRYPFAGKLNPKVRLGIVQIHRDSILNSVHSLSTTIHSGQTVDESRGERDEVHSEYDDPMQLESTAQEIAIELWERCQWFDPPMEASEYLARVNWLPDGTLVTQWQNRSQKCSILHRIDARRESNVSGSDKTYAKPPMLCEGHTLLIENSDIWINLHHMFKPLERPIHPSECHNEFKTEKSIPWMPNPLPNGSFSFIFASERTGYQHLYLYTYCPGINGEMAVLLKDLTAGDWMVESIAGVDLKNDLVYFTGTFDSVLERHLYAVPLLNQGDSRSYQSSSESQSMGIGISHQSSNERLVESSNGSMRRGFNKVMNVLSGGGKGHSSNQNRMRLKCSASNPFRLTVEYGMHNIVMDDHCRYFVTTSSDLDRPTTVTVYELIHERVDLVRVGMTLKSAEISVVRILSLYDASLDDRSICAMTGAQPSEGASHTLVKCLPPPDLFSFPTSDGRETLHAAIYRPNPLLHGPGPYPLICAVYGGPHVQRVNRSWSQCADMRAQRLRSLGFCVVKCDNRGSSRRGLMFESAISNRLGRVEVLDQVAVVRQLTLRGIADPLRVGIYGWSYGGYLAAMCLFRAPDVFHVAVAGAPVTSWDGYDTHYTERYMGLPSENVAGYRESALFEHVPNMRGKLMIVHGLIDENVHFRHSSRLINRLIATGKDYDLLIFPEERHSPRRLRDRIYMEQRISDYFIKHLGSNANPSALDLLTVASSGLLPSGLRTMAGHL